MDKELQLELYRRMVRIRKFEDGVIQVYLRGLMPGLAHAYSGEEAVGVGVCAALRDDDYITSTHRGHGHLIAKGGKTDRMMAEVLGKEAGYNRGRGGTMHIADLSLGILGANGIVGGGLGIAVGAAWAAKQKGTGQVSVCFYGDGAANQGVVAEAFNMAGIWQLPVIFVCENNLYGQFTSRARIAAGTRLGARAEAFGIPATEAYGQEVWSVYDIMVNLIEKARKGQPQYVEFKTYRYGGHHVGDPGKAYRPADEIADWQNNRDPIKLHADKLVKDGVCSRADVEAIDQEIQKEVDDAVEFAKAAPFPNESEVDRYVYPQS
ncbi:MAG TPA: thiamine pyrophosphate-dependent dehydrogenase E1 component subunit alpha [Chloroflexota bacterium]|nr:thiamine pyrophosphate-dependent dehydrogenase E1 component subunit alpha [Chloroflexota bacterium]